MAEADYLLAALPDRHIILGQPLRPFSLGHMMILRRMDNVFSKPDPIQVFAETTFNDLISGVFVCAQTFEDAIESLQDPKLPETLKEWSGQLGEFDVRAKVAAFVDYIAKGSTFPEMSEPEDEARMPGAPFLQRVKLVLVSELNHPESAALNKPFGSCLHDYFGFFELKNRIRILSEEDRETAAEHARLLDKLGPEIDRIKREANGGAR